MNFVRSLTARPALVCWIAATMVLPAAAGDTAEGVARRLEVKRGICVVLGEPSCELAMRLARRSKLLVYVQLPSSEHVVRARRTAEAAGLDATRLQIDQGALARQLHRRDAPVGRGAGWGGDRGVAAMEQWRRTERCVQPGLYSWSWLECRPHGGERRTHRR